MAEGGVTLFVCVSCKGQDAGVERPGRLLFDAVSDDMRAHADGVVTVTPVECLSVCKRPCTIALSGEGKWTYVIGDLNLVEHRADIVAGAVRYAATQDGVIPWRERPVCFRKGVVSRTPPLGFTPALKDA